MAAAAAQAGDEGRGLLPVRLGGRRRGGGRRRERKKDSMQNSTRVSRGDTNDYDSIENESDEMTHTHKT